MAPAQPSWMEKSTHNNVHLSWVRNRSGIRTEIQCILLRGKVLDPPTMPDTTSPNTTPTGNTEHITPYQICPHTWIAFARHQPHSRRKCSKTACSLFCAEHAPLLRRRTGRRRRRSRGKRNSSKTACPIYVGCRGKRNSSKTACPTCWGCLHNGLGEEEEEGVVYGVRWVSTSVMQGQRVV